MKPKGRSMMRRTTGLIWICTGAGLRIIQHWEN
jgi:hypothetical protein